MPSGDKSPIFDDLMRFKPDGMSPNAWATKAGVSRTVWTDMRRHGNPSRRTLQKLLNVVGSSLAEFEALRVSGGGTGEAPAGSGLSEHGSIGWRPAPLPPLPLLSAVLAGGWGDRADGIELIQVRTDELVERISRPASLAGDASAYGVTIVGNSMWPRFRPGCRVAVSPKAPVAIGDDVLVKLKASGSEASKGASVHVLIKELVRQDRDGVELRQFNPDVTFRVPNEQVETIERVVGELI